MTGGNRPPGWGAIRPGSSSSSNIEATVCPDQGPKRQNVDVHRLEASGI
jgi:hypothetical protein